MAGLRPTETDRMVAILKRLNRDTGIDDPVDRARDARRDGACVPRAGAPPRRDNRARRARGGGARARRDRILSRCGGDLLMLEVCDIDVFYGDAQALDRVSIDVEEGKIVAIVGANGAGKTSLIRTIAGMQRPARGPYHVSRRRHHRVAQPPGLQRRHRPGRRGSPGVRDPDGAGKPRSRRPAAAGPQQARREPRAGVCDVSDSRRTRAPGGWDAVRRGAADGLLSAAA